MAVTLVEEMSIPIGQSKALCFGTVTMDSSHLAAGEAVDAVGDIGYQKFAIAGGGGGYLGVWDKAAQKILVYRQSAATSALTAVPDTTDLSAVVFDFIAVRPA